MKQHEDKMFAVHPKHLKKEMLKELSKKSKAKMRVFCLSV